MHPDCIGVVEKAIGRKLRAKESEGFDNRVNETMRMLAKADKDWGAKSHAQRLQAVGDEMRAQDIAFADKKLQRKLSNLTAQARESNNLAMKALTMTGKTPHHRALFERLRQVDQYIRGTNHEMMADLVDTLHASEPRFLGMFENPKAVEAFAREVYGEATGDPVAAKAAKSYLEVMERARLRANAAGADIGKLDYGYLPQPHDVGRIARAGKDKWVNSISSQLNRSRYLDENGAILGDAEYRAMLENVYDTLSTEGRNKMVPGQASGKGSRASRYDEAHRALHFKDATSHLDYIREYGRGGMMESISGHVHQISKNIGLMEQLGANPNATVRLLKDLAESGDNKPGAREAGATVDMVWDDLNGTTAQPVSARLAAWGQATRNYITAAKLQGVMLSSITDAPLLALAAKHNGIPLGQTFTNTLKSFGGETSEAASRLGIAVDSIAGEMAQWHTDNLAQGWSGKLANATMKLTLVEQWTHALRRGFGLTFSSTLNTMRKTDWDGLKATDRARLAEGGITKKDWHIWQLAKETEYNGTKMLTKDGLRDIDDATLSQFGYTARDLNAASSKLLGYVDQEAHMAVLSPDLMTRATIRQGNRAGTVGGEITRSLMLFKSFPVAILVKHMRRLRNMPDNTSRAVYSAQMMTGLMMFGALALQLKEVANGKDPRDMTEGKFWGSAFAQGGGVGIFGDVLYTGMGGNARGGQANWTGLAGPVFGTAFDLANVTLGNLSEAAQGKDTKAGAEILRFTKGNMPLVNLWYARAAIDRLFVHDLQESISPGYLSKMKTRARKEFKQSYWWEPGEAVPDRAPDLEAAVGE